MHTFWKIIGLVIKNSFCAIFLLPGISFTTTHAQGCSDAGFCTAGAMQGGQKVNDTASEMGGIGISLTLGNGENGTMIISPQAEGKLYVSPRTYVEGKLPVSIAHGNRGSYNALGDPILTCSHIFTANGRNMLIATIGTRIGTGTANATYKGIPLPMPYQASLGTTDLIAGLGVTWGKYIALSAGYQQPLIQYNKNDYQPAIVYPATQSDNVYFASRELKRKGDILIRGEAHYQWRKMLAAAGPLLIYHLGEDTYTTADGRKASLTGSSGITLNIAASISHITKTARIDLLGGRPLIVRSYRPDGLTRSFVVTLRYTRFR